MDAPTPGHPTVFTHDAVVYETDCDHGRKGAEAAVGAVFQAAETAYRGADWHVVSLDVAYDPSVSHAHGTGSYEARLVTAPGLVPGADG